MDDQNIIRNRMLGVRLPALVQGVDRPVEKDACLHEREESEEGEETVGLGVHHNFLQLCLYLSHHLCARDASELFEESLK